MLIYATPAELEAWPGITTPVANADALLQSASLLVRARTKTAIYATDAEGYPTDAAIRGAFRDATCAHAAALAQAGINPAGGPAAAGDKVVTSKKIGSASIGYAAGAAETAAADRRRMLGTLVPDAHRILASEGLLNGEPLHSW